MKILNYNPSGSYSVEYIPNNDKCTPIKLDIRIDSSTATDPTTVVELLKNSAPQEFWSTEIGNTQINHDALQKLVNTVHEVTELNQSQVTTGYSTPAPNYRRPIVNNQTQPDVDAPGIEGFTPNQRVADLAEQQRIKLKVIIQQVIQEMAEGTI